MSRQVGPLGGFLSRSASAGIQFSAGAFAMAGFLFQMDLAVRGIAILFFLLLNALSGRRVRLLASVAVAAVIVAFNLLIPAGRVLLSVLGFPVTQGALRSGLAKAATLTGMIALSQFSIRSDLRLPGRIGGLLGRSLWYFERIMAERRRVDRRDIVGSVDAILLDVQGAGIPERSRSGRVRTTVGGALLLAAIDLLVWTPLAASLLLGRQLLSSW